jgi:hypothetical protein
MVKNKCKARQTGCGGGNGYSGSEKNAGGHADGEGPSK